MCENSDVPMVFHAEPYFWCQSSLSAPKAPVAIPARIVFATS